YYVSRETRRYVTVALNGDGGDECFAGYDRYAAMNLAQRYLRMVPTGILTNVAKLLPDMQSRSNPIGRGKRFLKSASLTPVQRYLRWMSSFDEKAKRDLYSPEFENQTNGFFTADIIKPWFARANGGGIVDASLLTDTMTYLPNDLLVKMDIASMTV